MNYRTRIGSPCPTCGKKQYLRDDGAETCLYKWLHRTVQDVQADIEALKSAIGIGSEASDSQASDAAYWLSIPMPMVIQARRDELARLEAELAWRQAGGAPIAPGRPIPTPEPQPQPHLKDLGEL